MTKTEIMEIVRSGRAREAFTHSILGTFDVTSMRNQAESLGELVTIPLDLICGHIRATRVFEEERITALPFESWSMDSGIFIITLGDDGKTVEHTMVDGHHRALRREREGRKTMTFWEIPIEKAIRPGPEMGTRADYDWGDSLIDGKIVKKVW